MSKNTNLKNELQTQDNENTDQTTSTSSTELAVLTILNMRDGYKSLRTINPYGAYKRKLFVLDSLNQPESSLINSKPFDFTFSKAPNRVLTSQIVNASLK